MITLLAFDGVFLPLAYRSLGQEVFCTVQEADYEIASYACQHSSLGILGQDSDFLIYDRFVLANKLCSCKNYEFTNWLLLDDRTFLIVV